MITATNLPQASGQTEDQMFIGVVSMPGTCDLDQFEFKDNYSQP